MCSSPCPREKLIGWLKDGTTGLGRLRAGLPKRLGCGRQDRHRLQWSFCRQCHRLAAGRAPILMAVYVDARNATYQQREAPHARIAALIVKEFSGADPAAFGSLGGQSAYLRNLRPRLPGGTPACHHLFFVAAKECGVRLHRASRPTIALLAAKARCSIPRSGRPPPPFCASFRSFMITGTVKFFNA